MTSKKLHKFANNEDQWYVEESWADDALFDAVPLGAINGKAVYDPFCGMGTIPKAAQRAGYVSLGTDLADRGYGPGGVDFFKDVHTCPGVNIVFNPPYNRLSQAIDHALKVTDDDAIICAFTRLSFLASSKRYKSFTERWPLAAVLVCSKRVNCLPGANILAGEKAGGGAIDYCWLVFMKSRVASSLPGIGFLIPKGDKHGD